MKRNAKNYITVLILAASFYFMAMTILLAHEAKKLEMTIEQSSSISVSTWYYIIAGLFGLLFGTVLVYWLFSDKNQYSFHETLEKTWKKWGISAGAIAGFFLGVGCSVSLVGKLPTLEMPKSAVQSNSVASSKTDNPQSEVHVFPIPDLPEVLPVENLVNRASGTAVVSGIESITASLNADQSDVSALLVETGGQASVISSEISKTGGASDELNSNLYGLNSAVLIKNDGILTMMNSVITTDAAGADGVSANGQNAYAGLSDSAITTNQAYSAGFSAMFQGLIEASNARITTLGDNSAAINVRANSQAGLENGSYQTSGSDSPIVKALGTVEGTGWNANSQISSIADLQEGALLNLKNSTISTGGQNSASESGGAFCLHQNDDSKSKKSISVILSSSTISFGSNSEYRDYAPLFAVNNVAFDITLSSNTITIPSFALLRQDGGTGTLKLDAQNIAGAIDTTEGSSLQILVTNGSSLFTTINAAGNDASVSLKIDASSTLSLESDMYLTSFENEDASNSNIAFNGNCIYVNGMAITQ